MWTPEEDDRLAQLVNIHGPKKWSQIASDLGTKGSKQCRRRWKNFISLEERKQGSWTPEEDAMLVDGHRRHGNKWTLIAQEIGGRTDNAVKNRWAALEKKRRGDDGLSGAAAAAAAGNSGMAMMYMPPVMRPQNDLLGVRRVIAKDQPRHRSAQQLQQLQQLQMQQLGGMQASEGPWAMEEVQQSDQLPYAMPAVTTSMVAPIPEAPISSMPIRKPDLIINIPGGSTAAEPQLPYSQRQQANMEFRGQQELQMQQLPGLGMELPPAAMRVDDDSC
ncbi:hypothetical protein OEZ86_007715 [Tetradesmus obliquus]|nr:hypothetical protein OEZ86_007715 [Tetradesmus obliquus]